MTPEQFCYWLQGFAENCRVVPPNQGQWESIVDHLNLVLKKETPVRMVPSPVPALPRTHVFPDSIGPALPRPHVFPDSGYLLTC